TYAHRRFRQQHPWLVASSVLIPLAVMWMTVHHYQALMSFFMFAASLHVLHQCAYLTDCYRLKACRKERPVARFIDYRVLLNSIHPIGLYKIVGGTFSLGGIAIIMPSFLLRQEVVYLEWVAFAAFLVAWLHKTTVEVQERTVNVPKTVLIGVTVFFAFLVPGA